MSIDSRATRDQLAADFDRVMDDIDALLGSAGTRVEGEVKAIRDRLLERLEDARLKIGDLHAEGIDRARRAARDTDVYVREHPWQAVGVGALLGLLLGVLIARR
jgi:ElaB/YqjD/DUF883 family membrane-anchored ribosome-binding protein